MDRFETTFTLDIDGRIIGEIDIRVSPCAWPQLPLTIEAAILGTNSPTEQWVEIPPHHALHDIMTAWLYHQRTDLLAQAKHAARLRQTAHDKPATTSHIQNI